MYGTIRKLHTDINTDLILKEIQFLLDEYPNESQLSLYSLTGNNEWFSGVGSPSGKPYAYNKINQELKDTYTSSVLSRYKGYYRWRILRLKFTENYTIHADRGDDRSLKYHYRIHIPLITNPKALVMFFKNGVCDTNEGLAKWHNLETGNGYLFNAGILHTALNGNTRDRIHIVGQRSK